MLTAKPQSRILQMMRYRGSRPGITELLLLDGNTAFSDVDLDASGLLPLLVVLIAEDHSGETSAPMTR
jgi:hypothetical protein